MVISVRMVVIVLALTGVVFCVGHERAMKVCTCDV